MARGWESKAVEDQIESAAERAARRNSEHEIVLAEQAKVREIESLQLSRTRVLQDIAASKNPRYKEQLQKSLDFLNEKLTSLGA